MDLPSLLHTLLHDSLRWCIFCRAMLCISEAIAVMRCPSVCPSVTFVDHVKTNKHIFEICSPSGSHTILVFPYQTGWRYSDGNPPNGGVEFSRWGIGTNHDSGLIAGYRRLLDVRSAKNIYRRQSWVYDTVGHAPLAIDRLLDVRTTKWQKQLPTTMQCRSHSRRFTSECLFVQHGRIRRREENRKKLIVRSDISEAETTNNKRLCSTFCIEAIQTRSIARPLCDSRASCLCMGLMGMPYSRGKLEMRSDQGKFSKQPGE